MQKLQKNNLITKKTITISFLVALVFSIIFTILSLSNNSSHDSFYVFIIGTPIFFIIPFILCVLFFIFKHYKKLIYYFASLIFIFILLGFNSEGGYFIKNFFISKKVPKEYKNYHSLEDIHDGEIEPFTFGKQQFKLFLNSDFFIDKFISSKNDLIIIIYKESNDDSSSKEEATKIFHKVNRDGKIISTYIKKGERFDDELIYNDFFVNPKKGYYKSWIIDNDTIRKPFITQNKDLKWTKKQENDLLLKIRNESLYYNKSSYFTNDDTKIQFVYFLNNKWYHLLTDIDETSILGSKNQTADMTITDKPNISPIYLQKINYGSYEVANGAMQPGSVEENTLNVSFYCQLPIGKDTLKFIMPQTFFENDTSGKTFWNVKGEQVQNYKKEFNKLNNWNNNFFINDKFNFQLFNRDSFGKHLLYIIKPIK